MHIILTLDPVFYPSKVQHFLTCWVWALGPTKAPSCDVGRPPLSELQRHTEAYLLLTRTVHR